jgi:MFS family permease
MAMVPPAGAAAVDAGLSPSGDPVRAASPASAAPEPPAGALTMPPARALAYIVAAIFLSLAQGLGMNAIAANISQIQGSFGVTVNEATWLMAAYMAPNASLSLILIKIRNQYGLRPFAEVGIVIFVAVSAVHLYVDDFRSALVLRFFAGMAASPMSSLAFLYMLEPFQPARKLNLGMCLSLANLSIAAPLARLISPSLLDLGQWHAIYTVEMGVALIALVLVYKLPLTSPPRSQVITFMDLVSYAFIAIGFGSLAVVLTVGRLYWWLEAPWLGILLAITAVSLTVAVIIELNRDSPLIDIRWLTSPPILHFAGVLLLFRIALSEQSAGAIAFLTQLGIVQGQAAVLWTAILIASVSAGVACAFVIKPGREPYIHAAALVLIAIGAFMDAHSTNLTRPEQMLVSQVLIAIGGALFLPPSLSAGMMMALKKGPTYILSFIAVFLTTQNLGGLFGSALLGTFVTIREKFHSSHIAEHITAANPFVAQRISQLGGAYGRVIGDRSLLNAEGVQLLSQQASREAYVLAYNDLFLLISAMSVFALIVLFLDLSIRSLRQASRPAAGQDAKSPS